MNERKKQKSYHIIDFMGKYDISCSTYIIHYTPLENKNNPYGLVTNSGLCETQKQPLWLSDKFRNLMSWQYGVFALKKSHASVWGKEMSMRVFIFHYWILVYCFVWFIIYVLCCCCFISLFKSCVGFSYLTIRSFLCFCLACELTRAQMGSSMSGMRVLLTQFITTNDV